jgi:PIN domain nuclease of toxin-antitoxin system
VIILDTHVLIYDSLSPRRLSQRARKAIEEGEKEGSLACSDISLWEIAMLIGKGRLDPGTDSSSFLELILKARPIEVLPITVQIATISSDDRLFTHYDPADRIIGATVIYHRGVLVSSDKNLQNVNGLKTVW